MATLEIFYAQEKIVQLRSEHTAGKVQDANNASHLSHHLSRYLGIEFSQDNKQESKKKPIRFKIIQIQKVPLIK